jgi:hypothetical protein
VLSIKGKEREAGKSARKKKEMIYKYCIENRFLY